MPSLIVRTCAVLVLIGGAALPLKAGQPDLATLRAEQLELRPQIEAGKGRYATVPKPQRERLLSRQAELLALLEGKQDAASLSADEQVAVRNALEALVAAEKDADDSRLVCKRSRSIGSHHDELPLGGPGAGRGRERAPEHRPVHPRLRQRHLGWSLPRRAYGSVGRPTLMDSSARRSG